MSATAAFRKRPTEGLLAGSDYEPGQLTRRLHQAVGEPRGGGSLVRRANLGRSICEVERSSSSSDQERPRYASFFVLMASEPECQLLAQRSAARRAGRGQPQYL